MRKMPFEPKSFGRFERGLTGGLAGTFVVVWLLGEKASSVPVAAAGDPFRLPLAGGWTFVLLIVAIIALNALFVAAETSIELLTSLHIKHAPEKITARLQDLLDEQPKYVAACSLGSQAARLAIIFAGLLLAQDFASFLFIDKGSNVPLNYGHILSAAAIIAVPLVVLNLILGELVPKSFAEMHVSGVSSRLYGFARVSSLLFSVPASMVVGLANLLTARFGGKARLTVTNAAEEQIKNIVEESGDIKGDEKELIHSVFEFADSVVREVMTPRVDLESKPVTAELSEVAKLIEQTGHSRIPLFEDTDDQIVGVVHAKDLLLAMVEGKDISLRELMRTALFVPENMNLHEAMALMREKRSQLLVVQDEFGGTAGIVTIEDIVEELVGDIVDEYDIEEPTILQGNEGWVVGGRTHLDDLNQHIGANFESEAFDTIGGFVFGLFGKQPKLAESIESEGYRFTVMGTNGRRIQQVKIVALPREAGEG